MKDSVNPIYVEIGKQIFEARDRKGMTQEQLAERISLKRTSITNIEKGKQQLLVHTLVKIAKELEVEVSSLIPTASEEKTVQIKTDKYPKKSLNWVKAALNKIEQQK